MNYDQLSLAGHEDEILKYLSGIPEIKKIFGLGELLKNQIKERVEQLPPFKKKTATKR